MPSQNFDFSKKEKEGNRGDMRKIHVTRQFFEASGRHGGFFEKTKDTFLDKVNGNKCAKFQVCIVFRWAWRHDTNTHIHTYSLQVKLGISSTGCSPNADFENIRILDGENLLFIDKSLFHLEILKVKSANFSNLASVSTTYHPQY